MSDDALYKAFLGELAALEQFRISYSGEHPGVPLSREDPDVRRITEALAMFTARTRRAAERSLGLSMLRMFRQHFPFLLSPVPAFGMLRARTLPTFVDTALVPRGTQVVLTPPAAHPARALTPAASAPARLLFRTLAPLRVLPIALERLDRIVLESSGYRMIAAFRAAHDRVHELGELRLYVNHLNDFQSSLTVFHALKRHTRRVLAVFDQDVGEETPGAECSCSFGAPETGGEPELFAHPLEHVRTFFHVPQQDLFISVQVPPPPRGFRRFSLCFELDPRFPRELKLAVDTLALNVVPMANLVRELADPIAYDAMRDRYPILHPDVTMRYRPHSVVGAYRLDREEGMVPLRPRVVGETSEAYEIEFEGHDTERRAFLTLDMPQGFAAPFRVAADAFWHQPLVETDEHVAYDVALFDRYFDGLKWDNVGALEHSHDSPLGDDIEGLLSLLSLKNKRFLERSELAFLFEALGATGSLPFSGLVRALKAARFEQKPYARGTTGYKYVYYLTFARIDGSELPLLDLFAHKALRALSAWSVDEVVELVVEVPSLEQRLVYT